MNARSRSVSIAVFLAVLAVGLSSAGPADKPSLAVFDFSLADASVGSGATQRPIGARGKDTVSRSETDLLTGKFVTGLTKSGKLSVVERNRLASLLEEARLGQQELTDPEKSPKLGKLIGADYFLFGSLTMMDGEVTYRRLPYETGEQMEMSLVVEANIRVVEAETGRVVVAESRKVKRSSRKVNPTERARAVSIEFRNEVLDALVKELVQGVVTGLFPIKVAAFDDGVAYLNRGRLEKGSRYVVLRLGDEIHDPDTNEILGRTETRIALLEVSGSEANFSKASVVKWFGDEEQLPTGSLCRPVAPDPTKQEANNQGVAK